MKLDSFKLFPLMFLSLIQDDTRVLCLPHYILTYAILNLLLSSKTPTRGGKSHLKVFKKVVFQGFFRLLASQLDDEC